MKKYLAISVAFLLVVGMGVSVVQADPPANSNKEEGRQSLEYRPVYYHTDQVVGTEVVDDDWWSGHDEDGTHYDSSTIKKTPNGKTLHDVLYFFQSWLIKRDYFKPFVMTEVGNNLYKSRGELINYEFKEDLPEGYEEYEGKKRRAVVTTWLKLDGEGEYKWMIKRVDYYSRGEGKPKYSSSLVYTVWWDQLGAENPVPDKLESVIEAGPANVGGQRP